MMKDYDFELNMMLEELENPAEELTLAKDTARAERRQRTRRAKARTAQAAALKKREIVQYDETGEIRERGKDRHYFTLYPDTDIIRVTTERQLPIRIRRKGVDR